MENVNFIFKFISSSYVKNLLEIVVKLKIKKCWPNRQSGRTKVGTAPICYSCGMMSCSTKSLTKACKDIHPGSLYVSINSKSGCRDQ